MSISELLEKEEGLRLKDYYYELPDELVAQTPLRRREDARLMVIDRSDGSIRHDRFARIHNYLPAQSLVILNNSRVVPVRLLGHKERSGGRVEIFLLRKLSDGYSHEVLMRPAHRIKQGDKIVFNGSTRFACSPQNSGSTRGRSVWAEVTDKEKKIVRFNEPHIQRLLANIGHMPLPPYIKRQETPEDREYYQTVYARHPGSVAAPTAGLHFTRPLLQSLKKNGHSIQWVTLHINYATFKPVEEEDIRRHRMHREYYSLGEQTAAALRRAKTGGQKVVAVGTTSCRVLESLAGSGRMKGQTDLFVYPGFRFRLTDCLVTNFHLPGSTLLMLVAAFAGYELIKAAYAAAIAERYRFYSYGDAMIIV